MSPEIHTTELPKISMETPLARAQQEAALLNEDLRDEIFVTPSDMAEMLAPDEVAESLGQKVQIMGRRLVELAGEHPVVAGLTGVGAGWLLNSAIRGPDPEDVGTRSRFRPSLFSTLLGIGIGWQASRAEQGVRSAGARANELAHEVKDKAADSIQETLEKIRDKGDELREHFGKHPAQFALAAAVTGALARRILWPRPKSQQEITERVLKELQRQGFIDDNR